jgi:hypothetical protein
MRPSNVSPIVKYKLRADHRQRHSMMLVPEPLYDVELVPQESVVMRLAVVAAVGFETGFPHLYDLVSLTLDIGALIVWKLPVAGQGHYSLAFVDRFDIAVAEESVLKWDFFYYL